MRTTVFGSVHGLEKTIVENHEDKVGLKMCLQNGNVVSPTDEHDRDEELLPRDLEPHCMTWRRVEEGGSANV